MIKILNSDVQVLTFIYLIWIKSLLCFQGDYYINQILAEFYYFKILDNLVPDLKYDKNDVLLELNPGIGGEEAKLFTLDMYEMYARYAAYKGWTFSTETLKQSDNGMVKCYIVYWIEWPFLMLKCLAYIISLHRSWSRFDYSPFITGGQLADLDKSS